MRITKVLLGLVLAAVYGIVVAGTSPVKAGFGVSPTNIYNEYLKPGAHFEKEITLSRSDPFEDLKIVIEPSLGEVESWFKFEPGLTFTFPKGESRKTFKVIVDVPANADYKSYEGVIRVKAMSANLEEGGVSIVKGARMDVDLVTTQLSVSEMTVRSLKMLDSVDGEPLKLEIVAENRGNVDLSPTASITIKNLQMENLEELSDSTVGTVAPNETKTLIAEFSTKLPPGEYFVEAGVWLDGKVIRQERLVFRINGKTPEIMETQEAGPVTSFKESFFLELGKFDWKQSLWLAPLMAIVTMIQYLVATLLWNIQWVKDRVIGKWAVVLGVTRKGRTALSLGVGLIVTVLVYLAVSGRQAPSLQQEPLPSPTVVPSASSGNVQGVSVDRDQEKPVGEPIMVGLRGDNGVALYPVYSQPDYKTNILYYAKEGEDLTVIEEKADWYRVVLKDGTGGWIAKASIKSVNTRER